jgi:hypothetical protein
MVVLVVGLREVFPLFTTISHFFPQNGETVKDKVETDYECFFTLKKFGGGLRVYSLLSSSGVLFSGRLQNETALGVHRQGG